MQLKVAASGMAHPLALIIMSLIKSSVSWPGLAMMPLIIVSFELTCIGFLALRLDLPVGPARFDYDYNLTRDPGEPLGPIQFTMEMTF